MTLSRENPSRDQNFAFALKAKKYHGTEQRAIIVFPRDYIQNYVFCLWNNISDELYNVCLVYLEPLKYLEKHQRHEKMFQTKFLWYERGYVVLGCPKSFFRFIGW